MLKKVLIEECRICAQYADAVVAELEPFFAEYNPKKHWGKVFGVDFNHSTILNELLGSADRSLGIYDNELNSITSIAIKNKPIVSLRFRV